MRLVLLTLSFMVISVIGYGQQSTNTAKPQIQAKTQTPVQPTTQQVVQPNVQTATQPTTPVPQTPATETLGAEAANPEDELLDLIKPVLILINEVSPDQIMVFDSTGKWLDTVKSVNMTIDVGSGSIVASLTTWKGVMKPKTPKVLKATIKELKSVSVEVFNDKLEEFNK